MSCHRILVILRIKYGRKTGNHLLQPGAVGRVLSTAVQYNEFSRHRSRKTMRPKSLTMAIVSPPFDSITIVFFQVRFNRG